MIMSAHRNTSHVSSSLCPDNFLLSAQGWLCLASSHYVTSTQAFMSRTCIEDIYHNTTRGRCAPFTKMKVSFFLGLVLLALSIIGRGAELSGTRSHRPRKLSSTAALTLELGVRTSGISMIQKGNSVKPVTWPPFSPRKSVASPRWKEEQSRSKRSALTLDQQQDVNVADIALTYSLDLGTARNIFRAADGDRNGSLNGQEVIAFFGLIDGALASKRVMPPRK